ncbi:MAG: toll/interleukin-1 receptor domain-containing protein [Acidobacteriota bacterium]
MASYDVFVAYGGPDAPHARALYEALVEQLGEDRVFLDKEQPLGTHWQQGVPEALDNSLLAALVISSTPHNGWYDKDEIVTAIDKQRHDEQTLVPVWVDGEPQRDSEKPFGIRALTGLDVPSEGGMDKAAKKLLGRLAKIRTALQRRRIRTNRELLNAALHLDRTDQWGAIQRIAHSNDDAYFLLYGQTFQNLRLFLDRIHHYLGKEVRPHLILELSYRFEGGYVSSVAEWEMQLAEKLRKKLRRRSGRLETLLAMAAAAQPLFLIIELPCSLRFEERNRKALQEFLERRWPELAAGAGGLGKRLLVSADFQDPATSRHRDISAWMLAQGEIKFEPMAEVKTPTRPEVVVFLQRCGFQESHLEFEDIMRGYDQIAEDPSLDFDRLSAFLDRHLGNHRIYLPPDETEPANGMDEDDEEGEV